MGKNKRATRKELEEVVGAVIEELRTLKTAFTALDSYVGLYVEWKGDSIEFSEHIKNKFSKSQIKAETSNIESSAKNEKKDRYKKISQSL